MSLYFSLVAWFDHPSPAFLGSTREQLLKLRDQTIDSFVLVNVRTWDSYTTNSKTAEYGRPGTRFAVSADFACGHSHSSAMCQSQGGQVPS